MERIIRGDSTVAGSGEEIVVGFLTNVQVGLCYRFAVLDVVPVGS